MVAITSKKSHSEPFTAGRLAKSTSKLLQECVDDPALVQELQHLPAVLQVDYAHLVMLASQGLIANHHAALIIRQLESLKAIGPENFATKPGYGSINLQIEEYLSQHLGPDIAGRLPIGRSRIDHGATVRRISDRSDVLKVQNELLTTQRILLVTGELYKDTATISYTHMQQAQPATFGHYLLAFNNRLVDSFEQLSQVYDRLNRSPLGSVGLSGTDLSIDRQITASLLGFSTTLGNSRTGRDAYYQVEVICALALIMTILNDLCTELHIQSTTEFGYIELDDSHCSTSSIFPQKKNPVALEAVKGKAAEAHGWVATALATFRNEGTGDQSSRCLTFLRNACTTTVNMLRLTGEIVGRLRINQERCNCQLSKAWVTTSRLGNILLLKHGVNYRSAHGIVARMVKNCINRGITPGEVTVEVFREAADEMSLFQVDISQEDLRNALDYKEFLRECKSAGGVGPLEFRQLLEQSKQQLVKNESWMKGKEHQLKEANSQMIRAVKKLMED